MVEFAPVEPEIKLLHSSDLHIDVSNDRTLAEGTQNLRHVLDSADDVTADMVLLAGDVFEHNRASAELIDFTTDLMARAGRPIVILPGNHDPLTEDSVYRRGKFTDISNITVLGLTHVSSVKFDELQLEVWGNAHFSYSDMQPLQDPRNRSSRWQIAMAHGHYDDSIDVREKYRPSWIMNDEDIAATGADYIALGHWNIAKSVCTQDVPAFYSGSPDYAGTVNVISLIEPGNIDVRRHPIV